MGGIGSGNWSRRSVRPVVGQLPAMDIRKWRVSGVLQPGKRFVAATMGQGTVRAVSARIRPQSVLFEFDAGATEFSPLLATWSVQIARTPCYFGGSRIWFVCPMSTCQRRTTVLYAGQFCIACRQCLGLLYPSQYFDKTERAFAQLRRINDRLRVDALRVREEARPAGMHEKTFLLLLAAQAAAQQRLLTNVSERFGPWADDNMSGTCGISVNHAP